MGYSSCVTCHYNSGGGGPLNDYGRALSATEIADNMFGPDDPDALAKQSGFLGTVELPNWWRPSLNYRGLYLKQNVGHNEQTRFIHMMADTSQVFRFDENDNIIVVTNFGYAPKPRNISPDVPQADKTWVSREHYLRWQMFDTFRVYAGLMDKSYGIKVPDHEAFARRYTYNAQDDQTHGVMFNYNDLPWDISAHAFVGNLQQNEDVRQAGYSLNMEYEVADRARIGISGETMKNQYNEVRAGALSTKVGVGSGSALLLETGIIDMQPKTGSGRTGFYAFFQPYLKFSRGLYFFNTAEYYTQDVIRDKTRYLRWGPGLQYFPFQRCEMRAEAWNERSYEAESVRDAEWSFLWQVHLWL